jgi:predicted NBD/HSP70 family sugar kinase
MTDSINQFPARAVDIREKNERLVLGLLFRAGRMSQSEVAIATGLKAPTVFRIFGELERSGLILPVDPPEGLTFERKGRRPTWYAVIPDAWRVVGMDFRAGSASVVVENFSAQVLYAEERPLRYGANADTIYQTLAELLGHALSIPESRGGPLLGIGLSAPGVVDLARGEVIEYPHIPELAGFPLGARLSKEFSTPVHLGNNATVAAVASYRYGDYQVASGIFAILIRSGVGGAFIKDGKPYEIGGRTALEIGHMVMDPDGPLCPCGEHGCLEAYLAEDALFKALSKIGPCPDIAALDALVASADPLVFKALAVPVECLKLAARGIKHLLEPDAFVIISRSRALSDYLAAEVTESIASMKATKGSRPVVSGTVWNPLLAGRAACDMVFDAYFS